MLVSVRLICRKGFFYEDANLLQDEAEKLYKKSKRYDLLNEFYQLSGQWSKVMPLVGNCFLAALVFVACV